MENNVIENIRSRRSVRNFKRDGISGELIEKITEAGGFAPSALNRQPWKFIIIDDSGLIRELAEIARKRIRIIYKLTPFLKFLSKDLKDQRVINALKKTAMSDQDTVFYDAPLVIIIANDTRYKDTSTDCHLAAQNMMLAAHSMGIGSCFVGRGKAIPKKILLKKFKLPRHYDICAHLVFGYPEEFIKTPPARKKDAVIRS